MKVTVAKSAGFCFGVDRAINIVFEQAENPSGPIYTYGPIIHNAVVVGELEEMGVQVIRSEEELNSLKSGTVIIRSHGVPKNILDSLKRPGITVVDATCPFVSRIHKLVAEATENGRHVIIAGNPEHPEVQGIVGWCENACTVVKNCEELGEITLKKDENHLLVAQTTFNFLEFKEIVEFLKNRGYYFTVANTICGATKERQDEARSISQSVDAMIVIGDMHSSNTQKLYEICKQFCKRTYFIETLDDLKPVNFQSPGHIGITAGASTPRKIIEEVQNYVRNEF